MQMKRSFLTFLVMIIMLACAWSPTLAGCSDGCLNPELPDDPIVFFLGGSDDCNENHGHPCVPCGATVDFSARD